MESFEIFEGFEKIEYKLETSPNIHDSALLKIGVDKSEITVVFADIENLENETLCFTFKDAKCTYLNFSNEFPFVTHQVWDTKISEVKNGNLKFSVWSVDGNSVGFPLILEVEFKTAKVELKSDNTQKYREFFISVNKALNKLNN